MKGNRKMARRKSFLIATAYSLKYDGFEFTPCLQTLPVQKANRNEMNMVSKENALSVLDKSAVSMIHGATLEVLDRVGVLVDSPSTLGLLKKNGYEVDARTRIVKMSESSVRDAVKSCKRNFRWEARSRKHSFDVVDGRTKFGPGAQCLYYIDPETEETRPATFEDGVRVCRLLDAIDTSSLGYIPIYPADIPVPEMNALLWAGQVIHSSKPAFGGSGDEESFEMMLRIADILLGDRELLRKKALFPGYVDPISPLGHDQYMLQTLTRFPEWDLPVIVMVMALAGATAPASLAGLLVQQNAEILSSIAIARCVTRSPKIVYGSVSCPMDMTSGIAATGTPEFALVGVASVQMARFYGLPSDVGAQSDSKVVDEQTAYEKMLAAITCTLSGADLAELFLGSTETFNACSPVQLMIDDEIASYVQRVAQGIEVNEEALSVDVISKTGPLGNFLKDPRTLTQFKQEHSKARLSDRSTRQQWTASGSKGAKQRAKERMASLLKSHVPEPLEPEVRKELDKFVKQYSRDFSVDRIEKLGK